MKWDANSQDLGNGFRDHGVATPISNHRGTVATVDGEGRNVVLLWLYDHRGGYALLMIDVETGKADQFPMPYDQGGDGPFASVLSSRNRFYSHFGSHFVEFDPVERAFTFHHRTVPQMAMSMTEDDAGRIWSGTYPNSAVACYDPETGAFRDYGSLYEQNWGQYPRAIAADAKEGSRVVLLGAGFIGCIVLEALAARKVQLTVIEMEDRMLPRMMDEPGGDMIKRWCEGKGITVLTSTRVEGIESAGGGLRLSLGDGSGLDADFVVCATGVSPNMGFLDGSGIETDQGILADNRLQTNIEGIFAAGDVAQGPDFSTGERMVQAIQPTATEHGRIAALNMAGRDTNYRGSLIMNVLNTVGLISSSYGLWDGVKGGEQAVASDPDNFKYLRLEFDGDVLVGALALGLTQHVGVIRGLMQTGVALGPWKDRLLADPHKVMDAYLEQTQNKAVIF